MLGTKFMIERAAQVFNEAVTAKYFIVDPVMVCRGENEVLNPENTDAMIKNLLPLATTVVTPNLFEDGKLAKCNKPIQTIDEMKQAAITIFQYGTKHVVIKGGKSLRNIDNTADQLYAYDLYYDGENFYQLSAPLFQKGFNHGAGCTFAAAITANLANGQTPYDAIVNAKAFVAAAIKHGWEMNKIVGGPVNPGAYNNIEHLTVDV